MYPSFLTVSYCYLAFALSTGLFWGLGYGFVRLLKVRLPFSFLSVFLCLLTGITLFSTGTAVAGTGGSTVQLLYFLLLGLLAYAYRSRLATGFNKQLSRLPAQSSARLLLILFISHGLSFGWIGISDLRWAEFPFAVPHRDLYFYSLCSEFIFSTGKENTYNLLNLFGSGYENMSPYHYFELWLNAGLYRMWGLPSLTAFLFVLTPLFIFGVFTGIVAVWEYFGKVKTGQLLLSGLLLTMAGTGAEIYKDLPKFEEIAGFTMHFIMQPWKMGSYMLFMLAFMLLSIYRQYLWAVVSAGCLMVATFLSIPGVVGGMLLVCGVGTFFPSFLPFSRKNLYVYTSLVLLIALLMPGIYSLGEQSGSVQPRMSSLFVSGVADIFRVKGRLNLYLGVGLQASAAFLPLALLLLYHLRRFSAPGSDVYRFIALMSVGTALSSLAGFAILTSLLDSYQIFFFTGCSMLAVLLIVSLIMYLSDKNRHPVFLGIGWLFIITIGLSRIFYNLTGGFFQMDNFYSSAYLTEISRVVKNMPELHYGGFLLGEADYDLVSTKNSKVPRIGMYLGFLPGRTAPLGLNDFSMPRDTTYSAFEEQSIRQSPVWQLMAEQKKKGTFVSEEAGMWDFIDRHHLSYLVLSQNVPLSESLRRRANQIITDPQSGERFVVLKPI
jgi:hypothetical protein